MKLLSIAVPSYNSQDYLDRCIKTLVTGGDRVEILIVNDGSKDRTPEMADEYERQYPGIVRAIHQENKGHGGAVNAGIQNATGRYFKVCDSDDWLNEEAFQKALDRLQSFEDEGNSIDLYVCNYVYETVGREHKKVIHYRGILPKNRRLTWDDVGRFGKGRHMLMHAMIYRTDLLKDMHLELPLHTFYVDNLYCYLPLRYVQSIYYDDLDLYRYYIGRSDQSIQENIMIKRIDQQIRVNLKMVDDMDFDALTNKKQYQAIVSYLDIITTVSCMLFLRMGTEEALQRRADLLDAIKKKNARVYKDVRYSLYGISMNLPGKLGRKISVWLYLAAQKIVGFN